MGRLTRLCALIIATFAASLTSLAHAQASREIKAGDILALEQNDIYNGWTKTSGGMWVKRSRDPDDRMATIERNECCFYILERGNERLVALGEPAVYSAAGGAEAIRVTDTYYFTMGADEDWLECSLMWMRPIFAWGSGPDELVNALFHDGDKFRTVRFEWDDDTCYTP